MRETQKVKMGKNGCAVTRKMAREFYAADIWSG
jgi:hypothetical protein